MRVQNNFKDDPAIASRYLADQLTAEEREEFETHLLRSPEVAEELEATARLKVGLGKLQDSGELPKLVGCEASFPATTFLAAAAFVPLAAIGLLFARTALMTEPSMLAASPGSFVDESGRELRPGESHALERLRGGNYDSAICSSRNPASHRTARPPGSNWWRCHPIQRRSVSDSGWGRDRARRYPQGTQSCA